MTVEEVSLFWERVKEEAKQKKITMKTLFHSIDVGERSGYGWITKKVLPPANYAILIAKILDVDLLDLLWGDDKPEVGGRKLRLAGETSFILPEAKYVQENLEARMLVKEVMDDPSLLPILHAIAVHKRPDSSAGARVK